MLRLIRGTGPRIGEEIRLGLPATIGRHPRATVVIRDTKSSRYHSRIVLQDEGPALEDLDSRNGTFLNGERIRAAPLVHGDQIRIGDTLLILADERGMQWMGRSIGEFEIIARTGRFRIASQYLARQPSMSREVSLILIDDDIDEARREAAVLAARRSGKVQSAAALRVFDIVEADGRTLIVSEPPSGRSLETVLAGPGEIKPRLLADIGIRLAGLAEQAHTAGVHLCGLDPRLVFVGKGGEVKVANVGMGEGPSRALHLSPEEREGQAPTAASDVFTIGSLLSRAARGMDPLEEVLSKATNREPSKRHPTPDDLAADLRKAQVAPPRRGPAAAAGGAAPEEEAPIGAGLRFLRGAAFTLLLASLFFLSSELTRLILTR